MALWRYSGIFAKISLIQTEYILEKASSNAKKSVLCTAIATDLQQLTAIPAIQLDFPEKKAYYPSKSLTLYVLYIILTYIWLL